MKSLGTELVYEPGKKINLLCYKHKISAQIVLPSLITFKSIK